MKITVRNFSLSALAGVVVAAASLLAFGGRTEYRLSQLETKKSTEIEAYDARNAERLKQIEAKIDSTTVDVRELRNDIKQIYDHLVRTK